MTIYNTGNIKVKVGSAEVVGSGTAFNTNVAAGYLFKLTSESTFYTVAAVNSATNITLSSRYANSSYWTGRSQNVASVGAATKIYSFTLSSLPIIQNYVVVTASERFTDNGAGVLAGAGSPAGSGTVDYDTGAITITLGTDLTATYNSVASYYSGDSRNSMSYQAVIDYTTNYSYPEMSTNDTNFQHLYTKSIRMIDSKMYNASMNNASANTVGIRTSGNIRLGANQYLLFGTETAEATIVAIGTALTATPQGSLYISTAGAIWIFDSSSTATRVTLN